jgi:hypothetical protein
VALCALHNFVTDGNPEEDAPLPVPEGTPDDDANFAGVEVGQGSDEGDASTNRDRIAEWMWRDYQGLGDTDSA